MTGQQYRVIADREKGDYLPLSEMQVGDVLWSRSVVTGDASVRHFNPPKPHRIERPVPTTAWRDSQGDVWTTGDDGLMHTPDATPFSREHVEKKWGPLVPVDEHPPLPTREQIAEAIYAVHAGSKQNWHKAAFRDDYLKEADAVLTLLQKGAER